TSLSDCAPAGRRSMRKALVGKNMAELIYPSVAIEASRILRYAGSGDENALSPVGACVRYAEPSRAGRLHSAARLRSSSAVSGSKAWLTLSRQTMLRSERMTSCPGPAVPRVVEFEPGTDRGFKRRFALRAYVPSARRVHYPPAPP